MASDHSSFVFTSACPRVVFGSGKITSLPEELHRLNVTRPIVVCSPTRTSLARTIGNILENASVTVAGIADRAVIHVPVEMTETSSGEGSAVGLAKAISFRTGLPHNYIPTTYSGSEMTAILGELKDGKKVPVTDAKILPAVVIYDVDLFMHLPKALTAVSGQCFGPPECSVEALYAQGASPVKSQLALESIKVLGESLPRVVADVSKVKERSAVLYGAFLAGMMVASTRIALQHKLAHTVAGCCSLPHADTHAILLPHTVAYNIGALDEDIVEGLGPPLVGQPAASVLDVVPALGTLLRTLEVRCALRDLGMDEKDIERTADTAMEEPYWNPRPLERKMVRKITRWAWAGELPRADL